MTDQEINEELKVTEQPVRTKAEIIKENKQAYEQQQEIKKRVARMREFYKSENETLRLIIENMELNFKHYQLSNNPDYIKMKQQQVEEQPK